MSGFQHPPAGRGAGRTGRPQRRKPLWRRIRWLRLFLFLIFLLGISGTVLAAGFLMGAVRAMGPITALRPEVAQTSFIYDRNGELLTEIHGPENRIVVPLEQIPEHVRQAFIAIEDERFYKHFGVDPIGIARALWNNLRGGHLQGASTITQQLARSAFLTQDRTWRRKIQEAILAIELERRFTKDEILEMYLNQIYFGNGAYGIQAAAYTYFGKPVEELTLAEGAVLAGIPKNPSAYPPPPIPEAGEEKETDEKAARNGRWRERQQLVLAKMRDLGMISEEQYQQALKEDVLGNRPKVNVQRQRRNLDVFGHFVDYVIQETTQHLKQQFMTRDGLGEAEAERRAQDLLYKGGLRIYTTIDPRLQEAAFEAQERHLNALGYKKPTADDPERGPQVGAVLIDVEQAQIVAMVGGRSYDARPGAKLLNRALRPQPLGSATKPLTAYGPAIAHGLTAATVVDDVRMVVPSGGGRKPIGNYDGRYFGYTPFRFGLKRSINIVAVRAVQLVGVDKAWEFGRKLGLPLVEKDKDLSPLGLGAYTNGVTPLQVADAYATLARGGVRVPAYAVTEIKDAEGRVLYKHQPKKEPVMDERVAYIIADMMREVMEPHRFPTGSELYSPSSGTGYQVHNRYFRRPAAGKTGTHQQTDVWFVGFTPQYAAAVWVGYDRNKELRSDAFGSTVPGPIWGRIMAAAHQGKPVRWFDQPRGIVSATVCANTGMLPGPNCPQELQYREIFIAGTQPREAENLWVKLQVCAENPDLLYAPNCNCTPVERAFFNRDAAELPPGAPQPRDYAFRPPDPEKASCTASPIFQRDRAPNEIWLTAQGAVPAALALQGNPGQKVTIRLTDVAGRNHSVAVPLPDRRVQVAAGQSVDVPLTLPDTPGTQEFRITATSQGAGGSATTLVIRLTVTVYGQGTTPGDEGDNGGGGDNGDNGDEGHNGGRNGGGRGEKKPEQVAVVLAGVGAIANPQRADVVPGQPVHVVVRDSMDMEHEKVTISVDGTPRAEFRIGAGKSRRVDLTFNAPGTHEVRVKCEDGGHLEDVTFTVEVKETENSQAARPRGAVRFLVDWDRWWEAIRNYLAA